MSIVPLRSAPSRFYPVKRFRHIFRGHYALFGNFEAALKWPIA
jgi:hypothetical protein